MRKRKEIETLRARVADLENRLEQARQTVKPKSVPVPKPQTPLPPILPQGRAVGVTFAASSIEEAGAIAAHFFAGA